MGQRSCCACCRCWTASSPSCPHWRYCLPVWRGCEGHLLRGGAASAHVCACLPLTGSHRGKRPLSAALLQAGVDVAGIVNDLQLLINKTSFPVVSEAVARPAAVSECAHAVAGWQRPVALSEKRCPSPSLPPLPITAPAQVLGSACKCLCTAAAKSPAAAPHLAETALAYYNWLCKLAEGQQGGVAMLTRVLFTLSQLCRCGVAGLGGMQRE